MKFVLVEIYPSDTDTSTELEVLVSKEECVPKGVALAQFLNREILDVVVNDDMLTLEEVQPQHIPSLEIKGVIGRWNKAWCVMLGDPSKDRRVIGYVDTYVPSPV